MNEIVFSPLVKSEAFPDLKIVQQESCLYCTSSPLRASDMQCPVCLFPQHGSETEKHDFVAPRREKAALHEGYENNMGLAQTFLQVMSGAQIVAILFHLKGVYPDYISTAIAGAIAIAFIILYVLSKKYPAPVFIAAIVFVLVSNLDLLLVKNMAWIISFLLIRLMVLISLINGIASYYKAVALEKELAIHPRLLEWRAS
ncbi:MAG: hypothetical protein ACRCYO_10495 [Bacteroidia bacterium]